MSNKINKLKLKKFRGATDETIFEFDPGKRLVVIFGENGTGKTTVLDAIDFACNKNNEVSLKNKSIGSQKYKYLMSLSSQLADLEVEIETVESKKCIAKFGSKGVVTADAGLPRVEILRRDSILKIINGQPKERFEEIREMVSYPRIKQIEDALREAQKNISKTYDDAVKAYLQEESNLKNVWDEVGDKSKDFMVWAKQRAVTDKVDLEKQKNYWDNLSRKSEGLQVINENIKTSMIKVSEFAGTLAQKNKDFQEKILGKIEKEGLNDLLENAKKYIERQKSISACPVCNNNIEKDTLITDINTRINQMKDLKQIQDEITSIASEKESLDGQVNKDKKAFDTLYQEIIELRKKNDTGQTKSAILTKEEDLDSLKILQSVNEWAIRATQAQKDFHQISLIQRSYGNYFEKKNEAEKCAKKAEKIKMLLQEIEQVRKKAVDSVLSGISSSVEKMYSRIHPDEGIGSVKFYLDPKKSESLEFDGTFQGNSVPPQAYYSESHLDTLGICVFLALSQYNCHDGVVLLDDVLTSVDQQHMGRFIDMLEEEAKSFQQVIVTTHYRPWRDRYRMPVKQSNEVQLIQLLPWTSDSGVRHTRTKFYVDEIRESINDPKFDRQKVASKSGILLEHLLDELSLKYECKVPRKSDHRYTLGEFFDAIDSKIRKIMAVSKNLADTVALQKILDDIQNTTFVRNEVGCHYSETGALLADEDVRDFGNKVVNFSELLLCEYCGSFPNKNKSGTYWECNCNKLKLYPLARPK